MIRKEIRSSKFCVLVKPVAATCVNCADNGHWMTAETDPSWLNNKLTSRLTSYRQLNSLHLEKQAYNVHDCYLASWSYWAVQMQSASKKSASWVTWAHAVLDYTRDATLVITLLIFVWHMQTLIDVASHWVGSAASVAHVLMGFRHQVSPSCTSR